MRNENTIKHSGNIQPEMIRSEKDSDLPFMPNLILIAGDGRNVGKTSLAEYILRNLSSGTAIVAVKVTPHMHELTAELKIFHQGQGFVLAEETGINDKDTSRFLQAGAGRSFLVMSGDENLEEAFAELKKHLPADAPVIAEAGSLHKLVNPALFFFILSREPEIKKKQYLAHHPVILAFDGNKFEPDIEGIAFENGRVTIKLTKDGCI